MAWKKNGTPRTPPEISVPPREEPSPGPVRVPAPASAVRPASPVPVGAPAGALVLPASLFFRGELSGSADLTVLGRFEGRISLTGNEVRVGPEGRVEADVEARVVVVEGEVEGNLTAGEQILVTAAAAVRGDLKAPRVAIEDGARFRGKIEMGGAEEG